MIPNQVDHEYDFGSWKGYAGQFSLDLLKELESHNDVEYIEEDTMVWAWGMESESAPSWGLTRISQRILDLKKDYSYASTAGAGVDVYVIDSGVYKDHSDFESRATSLANFVAGEEETDTCGHGTHVAGIIAGRQFGVAKAANIYAIKVLNSSGQGSTSQVLAGINHMVRHASKDPSRKKVVNMSLGGTYSKTLNEAVSAAVLEHNLPFFVAAGNTGDDACRYSPAAAPEAFPVGGSDNTDQIGWYSCVGPCVKIFAPGSGIVSDWNRPGSAKIMDGTSMAAPHVAGVAALFLSSGNKYTKAKDLYADILRYATPKIIRGPFGADDRTTQSLLYNKMEDVVKGARKGARKGRKNKH
ncbi:peptidase S8/S53 domain-containing protein [Lobosporangium transversale]|uniref:Peptidase S8/S53 domain-containing protein n=1 Tax=Lobosporangium transversale TaxID=64571 RepID=A0A1Y2GYN6_9FUNG|nr:peptidase S8/S53 domain-containing protein [Lobosporangium transversale]ORZ23883.1 peptidase S8/S53 domain-containing protein [Lobosporangium transversale]|eukprot:XP_021883697.1 peptidase S8/S53 domain-containing protein [Lobosporangium transversale]